MTNQDEYCMLNDVYWFPESGKWFYRYEMYEQSVDMKEESILYQNGTEEYKEFFSNLIDYK